jgi:lipopolysaccharide transport system permease protein
MTKHLRLLYRYRDLLWLWTAREVRVRYQQSLLGMAWAVIQPLSLTLVFTLVFSHIVRIETGGIPYPVFAYSALVPWTFFAAALGFGIPSLVNNMNLVSKIYFPREILPLASIGAAAVDFAVAFLIFLGMMLVYHLPLRPQIWWLAPLLLLQIVLMLGVTLAGSAAIVFFRDMRFLVPLLTQVWMYATPVIYPMDMVPADLRPYFALNPMAGIVNGYRQVLLRGEAPAAAELLTSALLTVVVFLFGYLLFKRAEPLFADVI